MSTGADPVLGRTEGRYGLQVSNIPADIQVRPRERIRTR